MALSILSGFGIKVGLYCVYISFVKSRNKIANVRSSGIQEVVVRNVISLWAVVWWHEGEKMGNIYYFMDIDSKQ